MYPLPPKVPIQVGGSYSDMLNIETKQYQILMFKHTFRYRIKHEGFYILAVKKIEAVGVVMCSLEVVSRYRDLQIQDDENY